MFYNSAKMHPNKQFKQDLLKNQRIKYQQTHYNFFRLKLFQVHDTTLLRHVL